MRVVATFRYCAAVLALLSATATSIAQTHAASSPAILRTDVFVTAPYDTNTAIVFFNTAVMPAGLGVPIGPWPARTAKWVAPPAGLRLARSDQESQWRHYWPGGESYAPKLGGQYVLALGGNRIVRGTLSNIGYLPVCDDTWLVGVVTVDEADRSRYAGEAEEGMVAYLASGAPKDSGGERDGSAPDVGSTVGSDRIVNAFPLAMLPMLDQAEDSKQEILLTEAREPSGVTYSLKRQTPGGLVPTGVFFINRCKISSAQ